VRKTLGGTSATKLSGGLKGPITFDKSITSADPNRSVSHPELSLNDAKIRPPTHDENKTVGVAEFQCGNIYLRIVQVDDKGKLFNAEFYRDKMTRMKLTHLALDTLIEFIVDQVKSHGRPEKPSRVPGPSLHFWHRLCLQIDHGVEPELGRASGQSQSVHAPGRSDGEGAEPRCPVLSPHYSTPRRHRVPAVPIWHPASSIRYLTLCIQHP